MVDKNKPADLPCTFHFHGADSEWEELVQLYRDEFWGHSDETHWIFRAEKRRKKDNHKNILESDEEKGVTRSNSEAYKVENKGGSYFQTSLDKAFASFEPYKVDENGKRYTRHDLEMSLLREFQRKAHHHLRHVPRMDNSLEWLTLMQHYKAPTRLLDWTYSFYVSVFFAVTRLDCNKEYAEVWGANAAWIGDSEKKIYRTRKLKRLAKRRKQDPINMDELHNAILEVFLKSGKKLVTNLNSFRLNDRLIIQQGTFLVQGDIDVSFDENLKEMGESAKLKEQMHRIVIDITGDKRKRILQELHRMNINNATLFPGLEGFAESVGTQLAYPEKFGIPKKKA